MKVSELFEESKNKLTNTIVIITDSISASQRKNIRETLRNYFLKNGNIRAALNFDEQGAEVAITVPNQEFLKKDIFTDIREIFINFLGENNINDAIEYYECNYPPPFPISLEGPQSQLHLTFKEHHIISGIEKLILKLDMLFLKNVDFIDGGVLSFLKLKGVDSLTLTAVGNNTKRWIAVVKKHFDGDKDILACQEELIEAGFKAQAKL